MSHKFYYFIPLLLCYGCGIGWYSEEYTIKTTKKDFVNKVDSFKNCHTEYKCYEHDKYGNIIDSDHAYAPYDIALGDSTLLYYSISIYIPSTEKIFRCYIIPYDSLSEDESFVMQFRFISDTNYLNVCDINTKDLSYKENKNYKKVLEQEILNKLDVEWENEGIFWGLLKNTVSRML